MNIIGGKCYEMHAFHSRKGTGISLSHEEELPMMTSIRKEVREFMHAAETLLGPMVGRLELNQDERGMIGLYIQQVAEKFPDEYHAGRVGGGERDKSAPAVCP
jgi:hypothetical protein